MNNVYVYNTLTKTRELLEPINPPFLNIYTCGPTVYDHSHIGHARASVVWDYIIRFLRFAGYKVAWTRNITDIDDKIINKAKELNLHPQKIARIYTHSYHEDMLSLNVEWPDYEPLATQYLQEIHKFINKLIENQFAYRIDDDIYFSTLKYKEYGKLKGISIDELEKGSGRIEPNPKKRNALDFALWKGVKETTEYGFDSPWGKGRPGWHIECSAMSTAIFGNSLDIHSGGDDLIFPHHENEIAQSESHSNSRFAKYWLHNGMVLVNGKKMAKSEGNFITIKEALKNFSGNVIRFFILNTHYRMPLNYTTEGLSAAQNGLSRLYEALETEQLKNSNTEKQYIDEYNAAMSDDFNSPRAFAVLFKLTDNINKENQSNIKLNLQNTLRYLLNTLGFKTYNNDLNYSSIINTLIDELCKWRIECKTNKDFSTADKVRDILTKSNIEIKDLSQNQYKWKAKSQ